MHAVTSCRVLPLLLSRIGVSGFFLFGHTAASRAIACGVRHDSFAAVDNEVSVSAEAMLLTLAAGARGLSLAIVNPARGVSPPINQPPL